MGKVPHWLHSLTNSELEHNLASYAFLRPLAQGGRPWEARPQCPPPTGVVQGQAHVLLDVLAYYSYGSVRKNEEIDESAILSLLHGERSIEEEEEDGKETDS